MKKITLIVISILMVTNVLAGCGNKTQNNSSYNFDENTYQSASTDEQNKTQDTNEPKSELKSFESEWGYSVEYPTSYNATSLSSTIDFVITDSDSGSNINIYTMDNLGEIEDLSKEDFETSMAAQGVAISTTSFTHTTLNGLDAIKTTYKLSGNDVMQVIYVNGAFVHYVTYTKMPNTSTEVNNDMEKVAVSLKAK